MVTVFEANNELRPLGEIGDKGEAWNGKVLVKALAKLIVEAAPDFARRGIREGCDEIQRSALETS